MMKKNRRKQLLILSTIIVILTISTINFFILFQPKSKPETSQIPKSIEKSLFLALQIFESQDFIIHVINSPTTDTLLPFGLEEGLYPKRVILLTKDFSIEMNPITEGIKIFEFTSEEGATSVESKVIKAIQKTPGYNITTLEPEKIDSIILRVYKLSHIPFIPEEEKEIVEFSPVYVGILKVKNYLITLAYGEKSTIENYISSLIIIFK
jgi:hypothetical protein